jgi:predicted MFS family arabinose efflux permease
MMFTGLTVATVTGVPLGTFLGQQLGWRAAFVAIVAIGIIALIFNLILVPSGLRKGTRTPLREQVKLVTSGRLLLAFAITALGYGGTFVVFTYLSPLLHEISGFQEKTVALILLVYGIAIAIGNAGYRVADLHLHGSVQDGCPDHYLLHGAARLHECSRAAGLCSNAGGPLCAGRP